VNNVFLHGDLEEVYKKNHSRFEIHGKRNKVFLLKKALYSTIPKSIVREIYKSNGFLRI